MMPLSDDSDDWSINPASYYSNTDRSSGSSLSSTPLASSSPTRARFPRRMMDLISGKFRRITSAMGSDQQQAEEPAGQGPMAECSSNSSSSKLRPKQLASLLKDRLDKLKAARFGEEEQQAETVGELKPMRCILPEFLMFDEMDEGPSVSGVVPLLTATVERKQEGNAEKEFEEGSLAKLINSTEPAIMLLNLRSSIPDGAAAAFKRNAEDSVWPFNKDKRGEVKIYDSGDVTISFGDSVFRMVFAARPPNEQEVVCMHMDKANKNSKMMSLGVVQYYIDIVSLLEDGVESPSIDKSMKDTEKTDASASD